MAAEGPVPAGSHANAVTGAKQKSSKRTAQYLVHRLFMEAVISSDRRTPLHTL